MIRPIYPSLSVTNRWRSGSGSRSEFPLKLRENQLDVLKVVSKQRLAISASSAAMLTELSKLPRCLMKRKDAREIGVDNNRSVLLAAIAIKAG